VESHRKVIPVWLWPLRWRGDDAGCFRLAICEKSTAGDLGTSTDNRAYSKHDSAASGRPAYRPPARPLAPGRPDSMPCGQKYLANASADLFLLVLSLGCTALVAFQVNLPRADGRISFTDVAARQNGHRSSTAARLPDSQLPEVNKPELILPVSMERRRNTCTQLIRKQTTHRPNRFKLTTRPTRARILSQCS
jgi:hypothetical protein